MNWIPIKTRKPEFPCLLLAQPSRTPLVFVALEPLNSVGWHEGYHTHWLPFTPPAPELSEGMRAFLHWDEQRAESVQPYTTESAWRAALEWASERAENEAKKWQPYSYPFNVMKEAANLIKP